MMSIPPGFGPIRLALSRRGGQSLLIFYHKPDSTPRTQRYDGKVYLADAQLDRVLDVLTRDAGGAVEHQGDAHRVSATNRAASSGAV